MKTYKNLYEKLISKENIELAIHNVVKGKLKRRQFKKLKDNPENYVRPVYDYLNNFYNYPHTPKQIYDGVVRKKRIIIVPTLMEQIAHHCVINVLKPIFTKSFYFHSYGSIPNKGMQSGKRAIEKYIRRHKPMYCLQMDVKKYFDSIPIDLLKARLKRIIKDERFLRVLCEICDVLPKGIPLGFYTSQWLANWYLTDLDHYIKEKLKADFYIRYMDDMVVLGNDKLKLHYIRESIEKELNKIGLKLKDNYSVFPIKSKAINFLGFKFYPNKTILRKNLFYKSCRKARRIYKRGATIYTARQMLSYKGWFIEADTKRAYERFIKPYTNFTNLAMIVSIYEKRRNIWSSENQKVA